MKRWIVLLCCIVVCATGCVGNEPPAVSLEESITTSRTVGAPTEESFVDETSATSTGSSTASQTVAKPQTSATKGSTAATSTVAKSTTTTTTARSTTTSRSTATLPPLAGNEAVDAILRGYTAEQLEVPEFDLAKYMQPIWQESLVYNESVLVVEEEDGSIAPITLAYDAAHIVEVRDSALNIVYQAGVDYRLENGKLVILPGGTIPTMTYDQYYPAKEGGTMPRVGGGYLKFAEGGYFHHFQIAVTYVHLDTWKSAVPAYQGGQLPQTLSKLNNKEPLHIVFFGDSIFTGANASGTVQGGSGQPYMPAWFDLLVDTLKVRFGYDGVTYANPSVGGATSGWGAENAAGMVAPEDPDLVVIGFGMNDPALPTSTYRQNIRRIMDAALAANPSCEFILTAPMLPNREAAGFYGNQEVFLNELKKLSGTGVAVMDITTPHRYLLSRKNYGDMTGNNVNHPNDFLCRLYAQVAVACLVR